MKNSATNRLGTKNKASMARSTGSLAPSAFIPMPLAQFGHAWISIANSHETNTGANRRMARARCWSNLLARAWTYAMAELSIIAAPQTLNAMRRPG